MTKYHHHRRHLRIVWGQHGEWIAQSCSSSPHIWHDIVQFRHYGEAASYVEEIMARDRILSEAEL